MSFRALSREALAGAGEGGGPARRTGDTGVMVRAPTLTLNSGSYLPQTASFVMFLSVPCTQGRHWHLITIESVSHRNLFSLFLSIYFNSALMTAPSHLRREPRSHSFSRSWHVPPSVLIEDKVTVLGNECRRLKGSHV